MWTTSKLRLSGRNVLPWKREYKRFNYVVFQNLLQTLILLIFPELCGIALCVFSRYLKRPKMNKMRENSLSLPQNF
jgi:hypothetical protein